MAFHPPLDMGIYALAGMVIRQITSMTSMTTGWVMVYLSLMAYSL